MANTIPSIRFDKNICHIGEKELSVSSVQDARIQENDRKKLILYIFNFTPFPSSRHPCIPAAGRVLWLYNHLFRKVITYL